MDRGAHRGWVRQGQAAPAAGQGRSAEPEPGSTEAVTARQYVAAVLDCYTALPDTPIRARKNDRCLAARLQEQGVPLGIVRAAFVLVTSRRRFRPSDADPLGPIRSLHYFVPVIEELRRTPPDPVYVELLRSRLRTGFPQLGVPQLTGTIP